MINQLLAIALGGAFGAILRFLIAGGVYQWLGKDFPYGTLVVNVSGCFLMGLLAEALILQRIAMTVEFRSGILVGVLGGLTTFSAFSLETFYLFEQGNYSKAGLNIGGSIFGCLIAVWLGVLVSRSLMLYSEGVIRGADWIFPYAMVVVNVLIAFLIGILISVLMHKIELALEYRVAVMIIMSGIFIVASSLYLLLYLIEHGHSMEINLNTVMSVFLGNSLACGFALWSGLWTGKQL